MIKISELQEMDIGRWVIWSDPGVNHTEKGRLKSWSREVLFVVFHCDNQWNRFNDFAAEACLPHECRFLAPYHPVQIQDIPRE